MWVQIDGSQKVFLTRWPEYKRLVGIALKTFLSFPFCVVQALGLLWPLVSSERSPTHSRSLGHNTAQKHTSLQWMLV